jgi:uncharacterized protein
MLGIRVLLFLLGIALVVWILLRLAKRTAIAQRPHKQVGDMVRCSNCGMYVPRNDAVRDGEHFYCSREHLNANR